MIHQITDKERDLSKMLQNATQRINDLESEVFEQARLLGMSGEREAALRAKIGVQEKTLKLALDYLDRLVRGLRLDADSEAVVVITVIREALGETK